jgi:alpha-tubulin suppressor-like RCC1 family protein
MRGASRSLGTVLALAFAASLGGGCASQPGANVGMGGAAGGPGGAPSTAGNSGAPGAAGQAGGTAGVTGTAGSGGNGGAASCALPVSAAGHGIPTQIFAAGNDTCALFSDGTIACWGDDSAGQLGDCGTTSRATPATVPGVQANYSFVMSPHKMCTVVYMSNFAGPVVCWGPGPPTAVQGAANGVALSDDHACGGVQAVGSQPAGTGCWGENSAGELGDGTTTSSQAAVRVLDIPLGDNVIVGPYFNCATSGSNGTGDLWCWGLNRNGQLGDGTTTSPVRPEQLNVPSIRSLAILGQYTLAGTTDGGLLCWGTGYCGDGAASTVARLSPTPVTLPQTMMYGPVGGAQGVCVELGDQSIWCWGSNKYGQVGDGTTSERLTPTSTGFTTQLPYQVYANADGSSFYTIAQYGWVYAWGHNDQGQLGDGTTTDRSTPTRIPGLSDVTQLVAGTSHACVTTYDGAVLCWGANQNGQVGDGTFVNRTSPVTVTF